MTRLDPSPCPLARRWQNSHRRVAARSCVALVLGVLFCATVPAVTIDGRLDEPEWERAQRFTEFRVADPYTLAVPRYSTEALLVSTPDGLLVGFICAQPVASRRIADQTPRDADNTGDRVDVFIDFDGDATVAYALAIARAGSVQDGTVTNEREYSTDWDGDFSYAVEEGDEQWQVEVLIPWTMASLRESRGASRTIAILFDRIVGETQERSSLHGISLLRPRFLSEFPRVEVEQFAGSVLHFFPYGSAATDLLRDRSDFKVGADVFWKPSGGLQLTAAVNPDFGQVEADELVVNFDAIETFFSDKRPFFTENQALFDVRTADDGLLIYTRRIGGLRDDDPTRAAEIDGALKFNGSAGPLDYGVLAAAERDYQSDVGRAFAAQRLRYAPGDWVLGTLLSWVDRPFQGREASVFSGDVAWRPDESWYLQTQAIGSRVRLDGEEVDDVGGHARLFYTPQTEWEQEFELLHFGGALDFNDMGFQLRAGLNRVDYVARRRLRDFAASDRLSATVWTINPQLRWNDSGERLGHYLRVSRDAHERTGAIHYSWIEVTTSGVDDLIARGNGVVNVGPRLLALIQAYQSTRFGKWRAYVEGRVLQEGEDDLALQLETKLEYFARANLNVSLTTRALGSRDWLVWQGENLLASFRRSQVLLASDINWLPAAGHEVRAKVQWLGLEAHDPKPLRISPSGDLVPSQDPVQPFTLNNFGLQLRYRWTFAPQSDLYIVYSRGGQHFEESTPHGLNDLLDTALELRDSDQFAIKVRYRL